VRRRIAKRLRQSEPTHDRTLASTPVLAASTPRERAS
jgi:hypothetical protein